MRQSHRVLPSGDVLIPLGDTSITYDPIGGQGYNSAARHAKWMAAAIIERGGEPFTTEWAAHAFDGFWEAHGRWACAWNNLMLTGLPPATGMALQYAASNPAFADSIFRDYFRPCGLMTWDHRSRRRTTKDRCARGGERA